MQKIGCGLGLMLEKARTIGDLHGSHKGGTGRNGGDPAGVVLKDLTGVSL